MTAVWHKLQENLLQHIQYKCDADLMEFLDKKDPAIIVHFPVIVGSGNGTYAKIERYYYYNQATIL